MKIWLSLLQWVSLVLQTQKAFTYDESGTTDLWSWYNVVNRFMVSLSFKMDRQTRNPWSFVSWRMFWKLSNLPALFDNYTPFGFHPDIFLCVNPSQMLLFVTLKLTEVPGFSPYRHLDYHYSTTRRLYLGRPKLVGRQHLESNAIGQRKVLRHM